MGILRIVGREAPVAIGAGESLLAAALRAGLDLPHGCLAGVCGECRVRVVAGSAVGPEIDGGLLACRATASEVTIALMPRPPAAPPPPPRRFESRVAAVTPLARGVVAVAIAAPSDGLAFLPGQYATLGFAGLPPRDFSLASLPGEARLVFHVRDAGPGTAGAFCATVLSIGDPVTVEAPFGRAHVRPDHRGPVLLVAGGTGLGAMLAIARSALSTATDRPVTLCAGARAEAELYGEADLAALAARRPAFRYALALSDPEGATGRPVGSAVDLALDRLAAVAGLKVYAAGPPGMVSALIRRLAAAGIDPAEIHADAFAPVTPPR